MLKTFAFSLLSVLSLSSFSGLAAQASNTVLNENESILRAVNRIEKTYEMHCKAAISHRTCLKITDAVPYCRETQDINCMGGLAGGSKVTISTVHTSKNKRGIPQPRKLKAINLSIDGNTPTPTDGLATILGSEIEDELANYYNSMGYACGGKPTELKWKCLNPTLDLLKIGCYAMSDLTCEDGREKIKLKKIYRANYDKKAEGDDCAKVKTPSIFSIKIKR